MDNKQVIKNIQKLMKYDEVVVVAPSDVPKTMLRVYAHGGMIGRLNTGSGHSHLLAESYYSEAKDYLSENQKKELKKIFKSLKDTDKILLSDNYLKLAIEAAKNKGKKKSNSDKRSPRERDIQTQIVKRFMRNSEHWFIADMEFFPSKKWKIGKGKPDLIVFDDDRKQLGVIELKYNNENMNNLKKHYDDFMKYYANPLEFNREMFRRIDEYLIEYNLVDIKFKDSVKAALGTKDEPSNNRIWFGFLFVVDDNNKKNPKGDIKSKIDAITGNEKSPIEDCRFLYVKSLDEIAENGLCYDNMLSYNDFKKVLDKEKK